jgi:16S rRNA (guanine527-N7)-methyltransferase
MDIKMNCGKAVEGDRYSSNLENKLRNYLIIGSMALGINLKAENIIHFIIYLKKIIYYQQKINLTSIKDPFDIIDKHFLDSLSCIGLVKGAITGYKRSTDIIDVGSGAGFPGVPVKIIFPRERMTLLEARKNRKLFLDEVVTELGLRDTVVVEDRAENIGRMEKYRGKYHIVLSRAVAPLSILCEYCLPLCKIQGIMIAFKGSSYQKEVSMNYNVIENLGGSLESVHLIKIPHSSHMRSILIIRKTRPTPENFPRRNGIPQKRPL